MEQQERAAIKMDVTSVFSQFARLVHIIGIISVGLWRSYFLRKNEVMIFTPKEVFERAAAKLH